MLDIEEGNQTVITEFILLGFGNLPELQPFLFLLFLMVYIVTTAGNLLIFFLVVADQHLHTPMYFFLGNLSCLETCYSSIIVPKMLADLLSGVGSISVSGCIAQFYFFGCCVAIETLLLAAMSYDRYLRANVIYMISRQVQNRANQTMITEFLLLGFEGGQNLQTVLLLLFLVIYIVTICGNLIIILLVVSDQHLHTPMYYFLGNLSCLETFYSSTIMPRMLYSLFTGDRSISVTSCVTQFYIFGILVTTECYLLAAMSFDRYLAICKPLHYTTQMTGRLCHQLAAGSWVSGGLASTITTSFMSQLVFCGPNEIDHFFCDLGPVIDLSCSNTHIIDSSVLILSSLCTFPPLLLTLASYVCIITAILKISSRSGRQKVFSTCSSHLTMVTVFYGTLIVVYIVPKTSTLRDLNKVFSLLYTILTPLLNPIIYSLRNNDVKEAIKRGSRKFAIHTGI
ncbi:olfactory receptor 6B1-like [Lacerta agilis]|uniref:olfactory receptor 6B1-like n=1 Tax=Lacerta agilis TaxID=80427 RepID=UPI0014195D36|nr:olfactory receptor 6B1-like [Lacerta agilis]